MTVYCFKLTALCLLVLFSPTPTKSIELTTVTIFISGLYLGYIMGRNTSTLHHKKKELSRLKDTAEQLVSTIKTASDKATQIEKLEQQRAKLKARTQKYDKQSGNKNDCTGHHSEPRPKEIILEEEQL